MEFKDLLKVLEEYYAKVNEVREVINHGNDKVNIFVKNQGLSLEEVFMAREEMCNASKGIASSIGSIMNIYLDKENDNFTIEKCIMPFVKTFNYYADKFLGWYK